MSSSFLEGWSIPPVADHPPADEDEQNESLVVQRFVKRVKWVNLAWFTSESGAIALVIDFWAKIPRAFRSYYEPSAYDLRWLELKVTLTRAWHTTDESCSSEISSSVNVNPIYWNPAIQRMIVIPHHEEDSALLVEAYKFKLIPKSLQVSVRHTELELKHISANLLS